VIRAVKYGDRDYLDEVRRQHRAIVEALRGTDAGIYRDRIRAHLPASSQAYRAAYAVKYGAAHRRQA
jgi:DNA-binding FadR family transcriptional regulator